ncbi:MAG: DUF1444 family protein, partial [Bacteroidota bacterium]
EILAKKGEREINHQLTNAYLKYKESPGELEMIRQNYLLASNLLYIEQEKIKKDRIVPIIKPRAYLDYMAQLNEEQDGYQSVVYEDYNDALIIVYAEDKERSISYFGERAFDKLGIAREDLREMSIQNLQNILPEVNRNGSEGTYMLTAGGDYEASLILLQGIWDKASIPVEGKFVIGIPNRDVLFVTGSANEEMVAEIQKYSQESYQSGSFALSDKLFIWDGEKFDLLED